MTTLKNNVRNILSRVYRIGNSKVDELSSTTELNEYGASIKHHVKASNKDAEVYSQIDYALEEKCGDTDHCMASAKFSGSQDILNFTFDGDIKDEKLDSCVATIYGKIKERIVVDLTTKYVKKKLFKVNLNNNFLNSNLTIQDNQIIGEDIINYNKHGITVDGNISTDIKVIPTLDDRKVIGQIDVNLSIPKELTDEQKDKVEDDINDIIGKLWYLKKSL